MRFLILIIFFSFSIKAQEIHEKIKIKKSDYSIYFFQTGKATDTISSSSNNTFFLKSGNARKCKSVIEVYNGRLSEIKKDSLYELSYMPGMNYRHLFKDSLIVTENPKNSFTPAKTKVVSPCSYFKTEVNGSGNAYGEKTILIKIVSASGDSTFLTNKYYYR